MSSFAWEQLLRRFSLSTFYAPPLLTSPRLTARDNAALKIAPVL
jgi:hypothetical protein